MALGRPRNASPPSRIYLASRTTRAVRALNHPKQGTYRCPGAEKLGGGGR
jgi:hypothetical protein